jgi:hypothetical protein
VQKPKKLAPATKIPAQKKKKSKRVPPAGFGGEGGVVLNNYFPALDPALLANMQAAQQMQQPEELSHKDQMYPKFGLDNLNAPPQSSNPNMVVQDQIDEVPPEQEEAESQENIQSAHPNFYPQQNLTSNKKVQQQQQ